MPKQPRRAYSDGATPASKALPKKRRFRTLRWIWRLTYLSAIGGAVYIGYSIYQDRHPEPQAEADPNKKTLVILGRTVYVLLSPPPFLVYLHQTLVIRKRSLI